METNQELLASLEKTSRQQVRYARLQCLFAALAAVCCGAMFLAVLSLLPQFQSITGQIQALITQAETILSNLESVTNALAQVDFSSMIRSVDSFVGSSQEGISQALEKINTLDIGSLNQAITDLNAVIKPLAEFFSKFR